MFIPARSMDSTLPIVGHLKQLSELEQDLSTGNIAPCYLFCGKHHLGKFTVAKLFASEILTQGFTEEEKGKAFHAIRRNVHPDLLVLDQLWIDDVCTDWDVIAKSSNVPQQHRAKYGVKTNTIGIDDVRSLQERLHETPQGNRLLCLIRSIERLHPTAANALLKILEEPPGHLVLCCTAESVNLLLPTIVSRMRIIHFSPVPTKDLVPLMNELPEEDKALLLSIARGAPGIILHALQDPDYLRAERQLHIDAHRFLDSPSPLTCLQHLSETLKRDVLESFLEHTFLHLRERLRSEDEEQVTNARRSLILLFSLLHSLKSNTQKQLLAGATALQLISR